MNDYKKYLLILSMALTGLLISVVIVNISVDPAGIYSDNFEDANAYVSKLEQSQYGMLMPKNSWGERDIKKALAKKSKNTDCVIIGSSHVMQISSASEEKSLTTYCPKLINLGVSGGTLEDYIALSYEAISNKHPEYIVFGIDPWGLDFNRDSRFSAYKDSYASALQNLETSKLKIWLYQTKYFWHLTTNAVNFEYLVASARELKKDKKVGVEEIFQEVKHPFSYEKGYVEAVTLSDGSHIYSQTYIAENTPPKVQIGGTDYKINSGSQTNQQAITLFINWVKFLEAKGIGIIFLMTPYHPNVWANDNPTKNALLEMEKLIKTLGVKYNIPVLGSYNPKTTGCNKDEFYDFMHATSSCLSKIR